MKQLPYNYDNFKKLHDKVDEQQDLIISLTAQLAVKSSKAKANKNVNKQTSES